MQSSRRSVLGHLALGSSGLVLGCGGPSSLDAHSSEPAGSGGESAGPRARIVRTHAPKPLPFDPSTLRGLSEPLIRSHHENNYAGAVRKLQECRRRLASASDDIPGFVWGGLAKSELVFANSVLLHELYFENLGGDGSEVSQPVGSAISEAFGDESGWQTDFRRCAMSLAGGSGWVILAYDGHRRELAHRVCSDHAHAGACDMPLLVLDMYEHAYHLDYGADAERYLEAFLANVRWDVVEQRLARAVSWTTG